MAGDPFCRLRVGVRQGVLELRFLGRAAEGLDGGEAALDDRRHLVEVARAHLLLVRHERVAAAARGELGLLHLLHVGRHAALGVVLVRTQRGRGSEIFRCIAAQQGGVLF